MEISENETELNNKSIDENNSNDSRTKKSTIKQKLKILLAEIIGTGLLVFFGCFSCIDWTQNPNMAFVSNIKIALTFGLTVMIIVQIFGHISFGIFNPAIAIAAMVNNLIDYKMGFFYMIAETIGAIFGYAVLFLVTPLKLFQTGENEPGLCVTMPHSSYSILDTFFTEFILTSTLVLVVCGVWHPENRNLVDSAPLRIGMAVTMIALTGGPATGASMNPVRSLAPALWNWDWDYHWIYWVSPMSAGLVTSLFYRYVYN